MRTEPVTVSMASHPPRQQGMLARVKELLPQVQGKKDVLRLYLNNYDFSIMDLLPKDPHLRVFLAGANRLLPDRGSQGKFWHVGLDTDTLLPTNGYWLTCDDDIKYPEGYVDYMIEGCKKYDDRVVVTIHGGTFRDLENGCLPNTPARQVRTLVEYWRQRDNDHQVHTAGCGITCFRPSVVHMTDSIMTGPLHSGDDEDLAVWAQRSAVPIIRLAGRHNWVTADDEAHIIEPLYSNAMALSMADAKVKTWRKWGFPPLYAPPKSPTQGTQGMFDRAMTKDEMSFCSKNLSSDALATMIVHRVLMGIPTSLIRMSDGERSLIECTKGNPVIPEQQDERWLARYGLLGADLKKTGEKLLEAGRTADYLACSISGVYLPQYRTWEYFPEREVFVDQFYATLWEATDRVGAVLSSAPKGVVVLHREAPQIAARLTARFGIKTTGVVLNSWKDHERIMNATTSQKERIFLVSGGPAGKWLCVQLAKISGSVVLDVGESLSGIWAK